MVSLHMKMQVRQPGRNIFDKRPKVLCSMSEDFEKRFSFVKKNYLFIRIYLWKTWIKCWQPRWKNFEIRPKKVTQCPTMIEKATTFLRTLLIFRRTHMDRWIAFFTTTPNFLLQKADKFLLNVRKFWTKSQKNVSVDIWRLLIFVFLSNKRNVFFH